MRKFSPAFVKGIFVVVGSIRFLGEPLGAVLLLLGGIVMLFEILSLRKAVPEGM